eukprot:s23_g77.t1
MCKEGNAVGASQRSRYKLTTGLLELLADGKFGTPFDSRCRAEGRRDVAPIAAALTTLRSRVCPLLDQKEVEQMEFTSELCA